MSATRARLVQEGLEIARRHREVEKDLARVTIANGIENADEFAQEIGVRKTVLIHAVQQAMKAGSSVPARRADPAKRSSAPAV